MNSDEGKLYMIRSDSAGEGADGWVTPEPADEVILDAVFEATDLAEDDVGDIASYVDVDDLAAVVEGDDEEVAFTVEDHDVVVSGDGTVDVTDA